MLSLPRGGFSMKTSVQFIVHRSFAYCFNNDGGSNFLTMSLSGLKIKGLSSLDKSFIHVLKIFEQVPSDTPNKSAKNSKLISSLSFIKVNTHKLI